MNIPESLEDVNKEWISEIWKGDFKDLRVSPLSNREGFTDTCRVNSDKFEWIISVVSEDEEIRAMVKKHGLFLKELAFYKKILPELKRYVSDKKIEIFATPEFVAGEYDEESGRGYLVLQDFISQGYRTEDSVLLLLSVNRTLEMIRRLGAFHGACASYRASNGGTNEHYGLNYLPISRESTWFQEDMEPALKEMYWTCLSFFKSVPGEEDLCRWFEKKMADPLRYHKNRTAKIRSLVHGDLWHNNLYFKDRSSLVNDWQMIHWGPAADDLCFILFSSTSARFRRRHWDEAINTYYESFSSTVRQCKVEFEKINLSFENFMDDVKASIPLAIFFCGNIRDLQLDNEFPVISDDESEFICIDATPSNTDSYKEPTVSTSKPEHSPEASKCNLFLLERRGLKKIPTIASHRELCKLEKLKEEGKHIGDIHPKEARAMRRKLYIDLYREAFNAHNI